MTSRGAPGVRSFPAWAALCASLVLLVARTAPAADARIAHSADPAAVVVSYTVAIGEIASADAGPSLRIYGDGRVEARYPAYMTRAGTHSSRLSPAELDALLGSLADAGILDFDADAVKRGKRDAVAARRASALAGAPTTIEIVADADTTTIEIHLDQAQKKIAWQGLRHDARSFPGVAALQGLAAAERRLEDVMERTADGGRAGQ